MSDPVVPMTTTKPRARRAPARARVAESWGSGVVGCTPNYPTTPPLHHSHATGPGLPAIEALERRALLSSTLSLSDIFVHPAHFTAGPRDSGAYDNGYTPAQIRQAYNFDSVSFQNGAVAGTGTGQTIAIVDAYNDQKLAADLAVFDKQYGISAPPSLKVVNQTGGSKLPPNNAGWANEIALDVEWAHAIAPQANILLVETNTENLSDLLGGVKYARVVPAVSVISMSWGGSEFYTFSGKEFTGEVDDDVDFTTPPGHQGITFVTAAGDNGASNGAGWPGESPNALTVGGTSLTIGASGAISSETTWSDTGGGFSEIEPEPAYQVGAQQSGARSTPDVAYDADPDNGIVIYDSIPYQGYVGFQETGGNSAGTPQWAALVAIADQGRALAGEGALDGADQTLPALYDLYSPPGTTGFSNYSNYFNDVIDTTSNGQPSTGLASTVGYDTATGLGSPKAAAVIGALVATTLTASIPDSPPATPPAAPVAGAFTAQPAGAAIVGTKSSISLRLTDAQPAPFAGPASISLYASTTPTLSSSAALLRAMTIPKLSLRARVTKTVKLNFTYPADLENGDYYLIASITAPAASATSFDVASTSAVSISPPSIELAAMFTNGDPTYVAPGQASAASLTIENLGTLMASATVSVSLYSSATSVLNSSATLLTTVPSVKLHLGPGDFRTFPINFTAPADAPGTYFLLASVTSVPPSDVALSSEVAAGGTIHP
jgi:hypothetical protein